MKILKHRNIVPVPGLAIRIIPGLNCYAELSEASGCLGKRRLRCVSCCAHEPKTWAKRRESLSANKIRERCSTKSLEQYHLLINQPRRLHRTV